MIFVHEVPPSALLCQKVLAAPLVPVTCVATIVVVTVPAQIVLEGNVYCVFGVTYTAASSVLTQAFAD